MKLLVAGLFPVILAVMLLPAVLFGGDDPARDACGNVIAGDQLDTVLATIRSIESGGNYQARSSSSTASGAYQMIDATWRTYAQAAGVDTTSYPSAWLAPPADQDAAATAHVNQILTDHDGRIELIPVAWYLPAAITNPALMDVVPANNTLTPRHYQARWLTEHRRQLAATDTSAPGSSAPGTAAPGTSAAGTGAPDSSAPDSSGPDRSSVDTRAVNPVPGRCDGGSITPLPGGWSLPGPRSLIDANPGVLDDPHHDYPAWDWIIPANTPIYAVRGGHVDRIRNWPHNWWTEGCGEHGGPGCDSCGVGATIVDDSGYRWTYCHGTTLTVALGGTVTPGEQIMWSGNSGRSGTAHLHLEIRTNDTRRCPQPLLDSLYHRRVGVDPAALPSTGCSS